MAGVGGIAGRLYRGEVSINFVRRQRTWYMISGIILLICVIALLTRGLNFSQDFTGGARLTCPATSSTSQNAISRVVTAAGGGDATVQYQSNALLHQWVVQTGTLPSATTQGVASAIEKAFHVTQSSMTIQIVGPTWGGTITSKET